MKESIKLLKVVFILLMVQIAWLVFFLGKPSAIIGFHNSTVPFLLTGIMYMIIGIEKEYFSSSKEINEHTINKLKNK